MDPDLIIDIGDLRQVLSGEEPVVIIEILDEDSDLTLDLNSVQTGGGSSALSYTHVQSTDSSEWIINHNLGYKPVVDVYNVGGMAVNTEIIHISSNQVRVYSIVPFKGHARLV